jgi:hypothetical protein
VKKNTLITTQRDYMMKYSSVYLCNFIDENKIKQGVPELKDRIPYSNLTLNEFIHTQYKCSGKPFVLQVGGPAMVY